MASDTRERATGDMVVKGEECELEKSRKSCDDNLGLPTVMGSRI
jgi:hypothetical protein